MIYVGEKLKTDRTFGHEIVELTTDFWNRVPLYMNPMLNPMRGV